MEIFDEDLQAARQFQSSQKDNFDLHLANEFTEILRGINRRYISHERCNRSFRITDNLGASATNSFNLSLPSFSPLTSIFTATDFFYGKIDGYYQINSSAGTFTIIFNTVTLGKAGQNPIVELQSIQNSKFFYSTTLGLPSASILLWRFPSQFVAGSTSSISMITPVNELAGGLFFTATTFPASNLNYQLQVFIDGYFLSSSIG